MRFLLLLLLIPTLSFSQVEEGEVIYDFLSINASFPGGKDSLNSFITNNLVYPELAQEIQEQGSVYIKFVVSKTGSTEQFVILKGATEVLNIAALKVLSIMPNWIPGELNGKPVSSYVICPVRFVLNDENVPERQ